MLNRILSAFVATIFLATSATTAVHASEDRVLVFAAASMKDALDEISADFESTNGAKIAVSFGSSAILANQIRQGAPASIYISANTQWMEVLQAEGLIEAETRFDIAGNRLALIAGKNLAPFDIGPDTDLASLLGNGRLATGLTDSVPAGIYAKAALQSLGLWEGVKGNLAETDNVRAALALVAAGEAPLGIVYASDIAAEDKVHLVATFPAASHPPITYPAALVTENVTEKARDFFAYLKTEAAQDALARNGFLPVHGAGQ